MIYAAFDFCPASTGSSIIAPPGALVHQAPDEMLPRHRHQSPLGLPKPYLMCRRACAAAAAGVPFPFPGCRLLQRAPALSDEEGNRVITVEAGGKTRLVSIPSGGTHPCSELLTQHEAVPPHAACGNPGCRDRRDGRRALMRPVFAASEPHRVGFDRPSPHLWMT